MPIFRLSDSLIFPPPHLSQEGGLLAVGGDLSVERLLLAYSMGIFPWFSEGEPILWWSPDPRLILYPKKIKISKSLKKIIKKEIFHVSMDTAFDKVIKSCANVHVKKNKETWISPDMIYAYCKLHKAGFAHSVEVWNNENKLVGGLYGISLGNSFFGESMFTKESNASKVALAALSRFLENLSFDFIDCQVTTNHLMSLGAIEIPRVVFLDNLKKTLNFPTIKGKWTQQWAATGEGPY